MLIQQRGLSLGGVLLVGVLLGPASASAHWCSNIFEGPARFVVKAEKT